MDNKNTAPFIPMGTEPTVYGGTTYPDGGQASVLPDKGKSAGETPQTSSGEAPRTTFEELAVKKGFRSADELALAYENLESQNKRVEMSLAELIKLKEEGLQSFTPESVPEKVETQEDALKVVEKVVKKMTRPLEDKLALQELFYKNSDAQQYALDMARIVKENPGINWDVAYRAAKFDALEKQSKDRGKQEAYQTIEQKKIMAMPSVKTTAKETRSLKDLVNDKSIPFSEVQKIMKERFSQ